MSDRSIIMAKSQLLGDCWETVVRRQRKRPTNSSVPDSTEETTAPSRPSPPRNNKSRISAKDTPSPIPGVASYGNAGTTTPPINSDPPKVQPNPRDRVFQAVCAALIKFNRQSLVHFTDPTHAQVITTKPTKYAYNESNVVTIGMKHRGIVVRELQFKLFRSPDFGSYQNFLLMDHGSGWHSFQDKLDGKLAPPGLIQPGDGGVKQQSQWWSNNGKTFPFMRLPAELQEEVYRGVLGEDMYPRTFYDGSWKFGCGTTDDDGRTTRLRKLDHTAKKVPLFDLAIKRASRQSTEEVEHFLWTSTRKCMADHLYFYGFLRHCFTDLHGVNNLTRLELDFSHREFILFFKIPLHPFERHEGFGRRELAEELRCLESVKELTLRFHSPYASKLDDPWGYTGGFNTSQWFCDWHGRRDVHGFTTSCNKTITDWIITGAFDTIKYFPKVVFASAIKDSVKEKWCLRLAEHKRGEKIDLSREMQVISSWMGGAPPCNCTTPCEYQEYSSHAHQVRCLGWCCGYNKSPSKQEEEEYHKKLCQYRFDFED
ncbi:hypothetical protein AC579_1551 [Pseudocercospora musae]|uniref:Uncharacterized protein n=1 Tax=Pseudocercospora musae TaxID=113226 RepID=A0A139IM10_9PEZI|nr:hypothetical protein AC579_1551 [Pseudocercospora musae]